jgi:hypothetical protein
MSIFAKARVGDNLGKISVSLKINFWMAVARHDSRIFGEETTT